MRAHPLPSPDITGPALTTPGDKHEAEAKQATFYTELWFVVLMAILGLILLAVLLSLILQRKISKQPYARERPPLVPLQKRMSPMSVYSQGETHMVRRLDCELFCRHAPHVCMHARINARLQTPAHACTSRWRSFLAEGKTAASALAVTISPVMCASSL